MPKRKTEQRSNSTKVAALTLLKSGVGPIQVSRELSIPTRTLRDWRKASMASGNWNGGAGDNNNVVMFGIYPLVNIDLICKFIASKLP